jgi:hypothetical protein
MVAIYKATITHPPHAPRAKSDPRSSVSNATVHPCGLLLYIMSLVLYSFRGTLRMSLQLGKVAKVHARLL